MIITEPRRARHAVCVAATLAVFALTTGRRADAREPDRAEALFQRARELMGTNDFAAACPMLEEAYSLDHGAGTLLALALCHEGVGKPATALREYRESLSLAVRANRSDRVMLAESHVQALEAAVPRIKVRVASPEPAGLSLTLDGAPVDRATFLAGAPVDPGKHELVAAAPTFVTWRTTFDVLAPSHAISIDVPLLNGAAPPPDRVVAPPTPVWSRTLGFVAGALGLVAGGVGTYYGVASFNAESRSKQNCNGTQCSPDGVRYNHDARTDALVSDVSFGVGGALALTGLILVLRSPSRAASPALGATFQVWGGGGRAGLGVATSW